MPRTTAPRLISAAGREAHAAAFAAHRLDPAAKAELVRDLHQMRFGDVVGPRHLGDRAQSLGTLRDVHQQAQRIVCHRRQAHCGLRFVQSVLGVVMNAVG
jgi:hypothetical protein